MEQLSIGPVHEVRRPDLQYLRAGKGFQLCWSEATGVSAILRRPTEGAGVGPIHLEQVRVELPAPLTGAGIDWLVVQGTGVELEHAVTALSQCKELPRILLVPLVPLETTENLDTGAEARWLRKVNAPEIRIFGERESARMTNWLRQCFARDLDIAYHLRNHWNRLMLETAGHVCLRLQGSYRNPWAPAADAPDWPARTRCLDPGQVRELSPLPAGEYIRSHERFLGVTLQSPSPAGSSECAECPVAITAQGTAGLPDEAPLSGWSVRLCDAPILTRGDLGESSVCGWDNRRLLPPLPLLEEPCSQVLSALLQRCFEEYRVAVLPYLTFRPERAERIRQPGKRTPVSVSSADILARLIWEAPARPRDTGPARSLRAIGAYLAAIGEAPAREFQRIRDRIVTQILVARIDAIEALSRDHQAPQMAADEIRGDIEGALVSGNTPDAAGADFAEAVRRYGRVLEIWPALVDAMTSREPHAYFSRTMFPAGLDMPA